MIKKKQLKLKSSYDSECHGKLFGSNYMLSY